MNWCPERIRLEIALMDARIRAALRAGDMDSALTLVSRKVGLRICAGEITVKLKQVRW